MEFSIPPPFDALIFNLSQNRIGENEQSLNKFKEFITHYRELRAIPKTLCGPIFAMIDLTYRCQLNCIYCYTNSPCTVNELTTEEWKKVIDDLAKLNTFLVCFSGGEPTLRTDYLELVKYAAKKGLIVNTVSNGVLIDENLATELKQAGINVVQISLDGSSQRIHDAVRGKGSFDKAVKAIKCLVEVGIPVAIAFAATRLNVADFPNVVNLAENLGARWVRTMYLLPIGRGKQYTPSDEDYVRLRRWIIKETLSGQRNIIIEFGDPIEHIKILPYLPNLTVDITADGWLIPSPYLPFAFGNVKKYSLVKLWEEGFNQIWQRPELREAGELIRNEYDLCKFTRVLDSGYQYYDLKGESDCYVTR